jgi:hypothetical protein
MVSGLLLARRALDPPQRQLRQNQRDTPPPLRRQRLPNGLGRGAAHDAIQASARLRKAPCSPESVTRRILSTYKRHLLWDIEAAFRIQKDQLNLRPIWHQREDRVQAHILVCFLAFALWKSLEMWQERAGLGNSPRTVLEELARIQSHDVVLPTAAHGEIRLRCIAQPDAAQAALLDRLGVNLPKRMRLPENEPLAISA